MLRQFILLSMFCVMCYSCKKSGSNADLNAVPYSERTNRIDSIVGIYHGTMNYHHDYDYAYHTYSFDTTYPYTITIYKIPKDSFTVSDGLFLNWTSANFRDTSDDYVAYDPNDAEEELHFFPANDSLTYSYSYFKPGSSLPFYDKKTFSGKK